MSDTESDSEHRYSKRTIRRLSSLAISSPAKPSDTQPAGMGFFSKKPEQYVPDSEEERIQASKVSKKNAAFVEVDGVIEIMSSSSDEPDLPMHQTRHERVNNEDTYLNLLPKVPGSCPDNHDASDSDGPVISINPPKARLKQARRKIIDTSDSDGSENEAPSNATTGVTSKAPTNPKGSNSAPKVSEPSMPLWADSDDESDGATLTFNEPTGSKKPTRRPGTSIKNNNKILVDAFRSTPSTPHGGTYLVSDRTPETTPTIARTQSSPAGDAYPRATSPTPPPPRPKAKSVSTLSTRPAAAPATPSRTGKGRVSKKALAVAEQGRREAYAQELFAELNKIVFGDGLPGETALLWNVRLQTTAGKARWHKSREGVHTCAIELATKVLDSDDRIRNTLSHEMCHLACWVINGHAAEGHGRIFKSWADKVMRKRPDIEVTTKHSYEIMYKFEWKCSKCSKIYGRHSKSIDPSKCLCGVCKEGELIPQFAQRPPRTPKTNAQSLMASGKTRDSPSSVAQAGKPSAGTPSALARGSPVTSGTSSDAELEMIAKKLSFVDLTDD